MDTRIRQGNTRPRLIVLLPACVDHRIELAHQIHRMAFREGRDVLYLTLDDGYEDDLSRAREMATLKAVTGGIWLDVSWCSAGPDDWLSRLQEIARPGDVVIYHTEQQVKNGIFRSVGIQDALKATLPCSIRPVSGFCPTEKAPAPAWALELLFWAGCLLILSAFTWLEIQVGLSMHTTAGKVVVFLTFCIQLGVLWAWSRIANA